jgi:two-component system, OmpR family, sensor histidine kinase CreC
MEDMMIDTANLLAELASDDLAQGQLKEGQGRFAAQVKRYATRPIDAKIWGLSKQSLDFRIYVTDDQGIVLFDSDNVAQGQDYSRWRDVARTLRGEYGARATREVQGDDSSSVFYVAAPVLHEGKIIGVLTVAKPISSIQDFIDRAERKVLFNGLLLLALSAAVGVIVTLWTVWNVRKLRRYAQAVGQTDAAPLPMPDVPGELGDLARAMQAMRERLEGREYIENYIRALTHELKSPVAAIRASGELLEEALPAAERERFAGQVVAQSQRLQRLVDKMLELSKLEQQAVLGGRLKGLQAHDLRSVMQQAVQQVESSFALKNIAKKLDFVPGSGPFLAKIDPDLLLLAISNLLDNALDFSPPGSCITLSLAQEQSSWIVAVQDQGPGVPDYAMPRLGERFFTTPRPEREGHAGERSGSGLGLAIVRQIMRLHGGQLRMRNTQPGLRVELVLPG